MTSCDDGLLRAYLDDELNDTERTAIAAHLAGCAQCRGRMGELHTAATRVTALLTDPSASPDPHIALNRFWSEMQDIKSQAGDVIIAPATIPFLSPAAPKEHTILRSKRMQTLNRPSNPRRTLFVGIAVLVVLLGLLALPPVRATADQLLDIFRVQNVVFVPVSQDRMQQLRNLKFDGSTLFISKPKSINNPAAPHTVGSLDEATRAVGFTVQQPTVFPSTPITTELRVVDRNVVQFQVNVESARQLFAALNVNDVTLPDSLGKSPITADVPPIAISRYSDTNYDLVLYQGHSPKVTLPEGVDLSQLGKAALRLLGMTPEQAQAMSTQINWNNTLIFPIPADVTNMKPVTIDGAQGLLVRAGSGDKSNSSNPNTDSGKNVQASKGPRSMLYWQRGEQVYMLEAQGGISEDDLMAAATSLR